MGPFRIYVFDYDDTLVQTCKHTTEILYPLLAKKENIIYLGKDKAKKHWGEDLEQSLSNVFDNITNMENVISSLLELHNKYPPPAFDLARLILTELLKRNVFVCIYTTGMKKLVNDGIINSIKMKPEQFHLIFSTPDFNTKKPSELIFRHIKNDYSDLYKQAVRDEEIIFIGDSINDYLTTKGTKSVFIGLTSGIHSKNDFREEGLSPDYIYTDINHIQDLLLNNAKGD